MIYSLIFSRASRMLRGVTQQVSMPCVCPMSVCGNFFSEQPPPVSYTHLTLPTILRV